MNRQNVYPANPTLTLHPLLENGHDALDTPDLANATLIGLTISWHDSANAASLKKAPDLLHTRGSNTDFLPKNATVAQATFELQFAASHRTHIVTVRSPSDVTLQFASKHSLIDASLHKSRFQVSKQMLQAAGASLLAISNAIAPAFDHKGDEHNLSLARRTIHA
jgi:hypothetical protein